MLQLDVQKLGRIAYRDGLEWQYRVADRVREGSCPDVLGLLEHEPVYTMGARGGRANLLTEESELGRRGIEVVDVDRGGDITYHGPGQLVAYPILLLERIGLGPSDYVHRLEDVIVDVLAARGFSAAADPTRPGVWVDGAKIAAVGVRCQRGVTRHGIAINVNLDLRPFAAIVPCGLPGVPVTSIERELGGSVSLGAVADEFARSFAHGFGFDPGPAQSPHASASGWG
jgi:lipoate-protein ligase B